MTPTLAMQAWFSSLTWIEIALLIFVGVFLAMLMRVLLAKRGTFNRAARIPLEDDPVVTSHKTTGERRS